MRSPDSIVIPCRCWAAHQSVCSWRVRNPSDRLTHCDRRLINAGMEHQPARSEYKKVWSALSTTEEQARLHVIGVTEEAALQSTGEETLRFLQDRVGIGKDDVVLEIGCGIGRVGKVVAPLCRKWIGCDVASNMLSLAAERLKDLSNVELVEISGYNLRALRMLRWTLFIAPWCSCISNPGTDTTTFQKRFVCCDPKVEFTWTTSIFARMAAGKCSKLIVRSHPQTVRLI